MLIEALAKQYQKAFNIFRNVVKNYYEELWINNENYKTPVWQISYHTLYCANSYCSAKQDEIVHWNKERENYHFYDKMHEMRDSNIKVIMPYSKEDIIEYMEIINTNVPNYLLHMEPEKKCWPYWYDETQIEFHMNNLRHIQHHVGEIIERHEIVKDFSYKWE